VTRTPAGVTSVCLLPSGSVMVETCAAATAGRAGDFAWAPASGAGRAVNTAASMAANATGPIVRCIDYLPDPYGTMG